MGYIIFLCALALLYAVAICLMRFIKNRSAANFAFCALVFLPYIALVIIVYRSVGAHDWNFTNTLPVANVSPFMFAITPLALILRGSAREYFCRLISLLSLGMLCSVAISCAYFASIDYKFHFHFVLDYVAHANLSLFGVFLVKSGQVDLKPKKCAISSSIIFASAAVMLVLNLVFDTAFFGLSLRGKHNIYNTVLTESSYLSALLYFSGLALVLCAGYAFLKLITAINNSKLNTGKEKID